MTKADDPPAMAQQSKKKRNDDDTPPDTGSKPIQLQRRRVWRACESCRRKKIKCDGCEPTCSQCTASGSQCTWLQTKDRAALSRHYVQELEARLLHMESLFSQIAPVLKQIAPNGDNSLNPSFANGSVSIPPEIAAPASEILRSIAPADSQQTSAFPIKVEDDVSESLGQLALDEYGHMRWIGGSSTMSLIQSFKAVTTSPLNRISPMEEDPRAPGPSANKLYFPASVYFGKVHALPGPEEVEYPDRDLADKLVNAYFARFHFLMPVIDKPSFLQQYYNIMNNIHDRDLIRSQTAFISLIFAVFACAANLVQDDRLFSNGRTDEGGMGMVYYERSLILQYISHANIQPAHVQCFILLSSFLCSINCLPQAWILVGQAVRTGQDLGLHRSPRRLVVSPIEKETRRKIWWGVYTLDRMLAVALGRPLGINDSDCDVEYPLDVDDDNLPEYFSGATMTQNSMSLMTGIIALIKLYQIAGRVLRDVYAIENCKDHLEPDRKAELQRMVESLDTDLTQWCDQLPAVFKSQSETDEQVSMGAILCSHYYSVLTTLHRNMLPVRRDQPVAAPKSTVKAVSSARSCIRLAPSMKNVVPPSHHLAFFIQHLFSSAVILLLYAMHSPEPRAASAAMDEAKSTLSALESWEGQWPGARKCRELLLELSNTATEAITQAQAGTPGNEPNIPISVAPSAVVSPGMHERQRSLSSASPSTIAGRALKGAGRTRRTQSREPGTTSRRMAAVSPYRVDTNARARSSSRRRGQNEDIERAGSSMGPYFHSLSSPTSGSNHSSPASGNIPSPITTVNDGPEASPTLASAQATQSFSYGSPGMSSTQIPSPRYDSFEFGMSNNLNNLPGSSQSWNSQGVDFYSPSDSVMYGGSNGVFPSNLDPYSTFDSVHDMNSGLNGLSTTPPTASFDAPGLPFRGLEFIRNYSSGGYSAGDNFIGEQDSLWQSYDPMAFYHHPDLPFTLGDPDIQGAATG